MISEYIRTNQSQLVEMLQKFELIDFEFSEVAPDLNFLGHRRWTLGASDIIPFKRPIDEWVDAAWERNR